MSETSSAVPRETEPVSTTSSTSAGNASAMRWASARSSSLLGVATARIYPGCSHGSRDRIEPPQGDLGEPPLRRGLVQRRAAGPRRPLRPERRREDDAPPD